MQVIILSIGDELVLGQTVDTNSAWLSANLAERGLSTLYHQTVADDRAAIAEAIELASHRCDIMLVSGGLGPTDDDLTRQALADAMHVDLVEDSESLEAIRKMMERFGRKMADRNKVQALCPRGAKMIPNDCGTAPGIRARLNRAEIFVAPGVPRELFAMYEKSIAPHMPAADRVILTRKVNTFGMGESNVAEVLGALCDRKRNPLIGTTVSDGIVSVRIRSEFNDADLARREMDDSIRQVENTLGPICFSHEDVTMQQQVVALLKEKGKTVTTAESCTGGLIGKMITDVAGSSAAYLGGWVTYTNELKTSELGVDPELIEVNGAVSEPVALAMAEGARRKTNADLAVSVTGVAGPDGGTTEKPVGMVWIGFAARGTNPEARLFTLGGERESIRDRAAKCALQLIRLHLLNQSFDLLRWGRREISKSEKQERRK